MFDKEKKAKEELEAVKTSLNVEKELVAFYKNQYEYSKFNNERLQKETESANYKVKLLELLLKQLRVNVTLSAKKVAKESL